MKPVSKAVKLLGSMLALLWVPVLMAAEPAAPPADAGATAAPKQGAPRFKGIKMKPVDYREPMREYNPVISNGWTIEVERALVEADPELAKKAVARLSLNLNKTLELLPPHSHNNLRKLRVFLMYGPKAPGDGRDNGAEYFQVRAPDCYKTLDPRWRHSIVFYCAENYVWQNELWALKLPMHEIMHAHHLAQWPEDRAEICRAYDHAMSLKLYTNVKSLDGKTIPKAYATQNPMEYFAELSCMYFAACDYQPSTREDLKAYDPEGYEMIRAMWEIKD